MRKYIKVNQPLANREPEGLEEVIVALNIVETILRQLCAKKIPVKIEDNEEDYSFVFVKWNEKVRHMAVF